MNVILMLPWVKGPMSEELALLWSLPNFPKHEQGLKDSQSLILYSSDTKTGMLQLVVSDENICNENGKPSTPSSSLASIYNHYFHTLLIPSKNLTRH